VNGRPFGLLHILRVNIVRAVQRSLGFLLAGLMIGVLLGFVLAPNARKGEADRPLSDPIANKRSQARRESSALKSSGEGNKIVLGNISTVPFQELYGVLSSRSREEMAQLAEQLKELPAGRETNVKIAVFFKAWAHLDAKAAFNAAVSFKSAEARSAATEAVIDNADPIVASSLAQSVVALPPDAFPSGQRADFLGQALSKWSEIDPVAAAKFLDASASKDKDRALTGARVTIAENWAASDPQAALAWAQSQNDEQSARIAVSAAVSGWWRTDPRAAEAYVASHLDTLGREAVMSVTRQIFGQDPQRAKDWANQLSTTEARRAATTVVALQIANSDPKSAVEWVVTLPDDLRERAIPGVVNTWARRDPDAFVGWINGLVVGNQRDQAVGAYSSILSSRDPTTALTWAASISDEKIRDNSVHRIVTNWLRRSPNEATDWIQNSTLSDAEKTRLLTLSSK
jgi:hypothetical protein